MASLLYHKLVTINIMLNMCAGPHAVKGVRLIITSAWCMTILELYSTYNYIERVSNMYELMD